jgi:hypothetical protein
MSKQGRTLDEFTAAHDPLYVDASPVPIYDWKPVRGTKRFLFTAAQNATPVHANWWRVLCSVAEHTGADLRVLPIRYKNPTSRWTGSQQGSEWWAPETRSFLTNVRVPLNENLMLLGDFKIQPTAGDPLTRAESVSGTSSAIVAHTKIQTRSIATPSNRMAKLMMTSGACTEANYSDTRAGRIGEFHHSLSAVLVEIDSAKRFYMRRLHYDEKTKSCTDSATGNQYTATGVRLAPRALALILGDLHCDYADPKALEATYGPGGMVESGRPRHIVYHDIVDGYSANPHHAGNPFNAIAKRFSGADDVRGEIERTIQFVRDHTVPDTDNVIVASNHDDFIRRWIIATDWREDPTNADFYLETALEMVRGTKLGPSGTEYPSPFAYWMRRAEIPQTRVLSGDESFMLGGVELGLHGDRGPNGARGNIRNLKRIGVKTVTGHPHSPGEDEGCTQVGTMTRLRLEYNGGPSSWLQANCFLGADGKRQLCVIVDGKYRL